MGALGHGVCGFVHLPLPLTGQRGRRRVPLLPVQGNQGHQVMTTGVTGLCLLLNEVDMKRSEPWSQGYSSNEVSSGK